MATRRGELRVLRGTVIHGPMTREQLAGLVAVGRVAGTDLVSVAEGPWSPVAAYLGGGDRSEAGDGRVEGVGTAPTPSSSPWHYARGGSQLGPVSGEQLKELVALGNLSPTDLIWREGLPDWRPAGTLRGLFPSPVVGPISPPPLPTTATPPSTPIAPPPTTAVLGDQAPRRPSIFDKARELTRKVKVKAGEIQSEARARAERIRLEAQTNQTAAPSAVTRGVKAAAYARSDEAKEQARKARDAAEGGARTAKSLAASLLATSRERFGKAANRPPAIGIAAAMACLLGLTLVLRTPRIGQHLPAKGQNTAGQTPEIDGSGAGGARPAAHGTYERVQPRARGLLPKVGELIEEDRAVRAFLDVMVGQQAIIEAKHEIPKKFLRKVGEALEGEAKRSEENLFQRWRVEGRRDSSKLLAEEARKKGSVLPTTKELEEKLASAKAQRDAFEKVSDAYAREARVYFDDRYDVYKKEVPRGALDRSIDGTDEDRPAKTLGRNIDKLKRLRVITPRIEAFSQVDGADQAIAAIKELLAALDSGGGPEQALGHWNRVRELYRELKQAASEWEASVRASVRAATPTASTAGLHDVAGFSHLIDGDRYYIENKVVRIPRKYLSLYSEGSAGPNQMGISGAFRFTGNATGKNALGATINVETYEADEAYSEARLAGLAVERQYADFFQAIERRSLAEDDISGLLGIYESLLGKEAIEGVKRALLAKASTSGNGAGLRKEANEESLHTTKPRITHTDSRRPPDASGPPPH